MERREIEKNFLKAVHFKNPEWLPCTVGFLPASWIKYREQLEDILAAHPRLFPNFKKGEKNFDELPEAPSFKPGRYIDNWGCTWENEQLGMEGVCIKGALENWDAFENYTPPDPLTKYTLFCDRPDWKKIKHII